MTGTTSIVTDALRDALGLCDYLQRIWPEVGSLPSVAETRAKATAALELLTEAQARQGDSVGEALRDLAATVEKLRVAVESNGRWQYGSAAVNPR